MPGHLVGTEKAAELVVVQMGWARGVCDVGIWDRCGFVSYTVTPASDSQL